MAASVFYSTWGHVLQGRRYNDISRVAQRDRPLPEKTSALQPTEDQDGIIGFGV